MRRVPSEATAVETWSWNGQGKGRRMGDSGLDAAGPEETTLESLYFIRGVNR